MRLAPRLAAAVSGAVLLLTLGACGGEEEPAAAEPSPSQAPSTAVAGEPDAGDAATSTDPEEAQSGGTVGAWLERLKAGMGEEGAVHVEMTMTGPVSMDASGDTTYGPDGSEMRLEMAMDNMPGGPMEMVLVDGTAYMSMPGVTRPGKFFEVDQSNPAFGQLDDGLSPADSFKAFDAGLQQVQDLGEDTIAGEPVTHYRLEVDAAKALEATGQPTVPGLPEMLTYDVWLDQQDRMRRLVYELAGTELTMDMTAWGQDVTIEAPARGDIVEAPQM